MSNVRKTLSAIFKFLIHALAKVEVEGIENIPADGGALLATNHSSQIDAPLLMVAVDRDDLAALVTDKYKKFLFYRFIIESAGLIWIDREKADFQAFRSAIAHLKKGGLLGIAPEGTRNKDGSLIQAKSGVALLADRADVPIIPTAIIGTTNAIRRMLTLQFPKFIIRFGKPMRLPPIEREDREESLQRNTDEIMCQIASLLPKSNWGVYKNHPRLTELLQTS
jgi:1-acyl-sn-glycerol-3-phosphate acyltransferase